VYFVEQGFERLDSARPLARIDAPAGTVRTALLPAAASDVKEGDPTGCGDVFGATYFARLLCGDKFADALQLALRAAARKLSHRGATHLAFHLRGELSPS